jgi:hypothetical protein
MSAIEVPYTYSDRAVAAMERYIARQARAEHQTKKEQRSLRRRVAAIGLLGETALEDVAQSDPITFSMLATEVVAVLKKRGLITETESRRIAARMDKAKGQR